MQILKFPSKKINKKKLIFFIALLTIILIFIVFWLIYTLNSSFREFIDINILRKEINADNLSIIELSPNEDNYFHAYDQYIAVLNKNILFTYNSSAEEIKKNDINITSPIFSSNNKFLAIAENGGNKLYLISATNILWQTTIDGNITNINVNKNGYVSVIVSGTNYKSVVVLYNQKGNELFKTYLSSNIAIDATISNDNKYLSIAEIDYSGSVIKSMVKNISIEKAKTDPINSVIYNYELPENTLLIDIQFQEKNNLICKCNDNIYLFNISDLSDKNILKYNNFEFIDINLKNNLVYTYSKSFGFTNTSYINIFNIHNYSINNYELNGSIKSILGNNNKIAINTGTQIHFIGLNGWLIKKYESYNEINNILLGENIAGIVYKNRIEILEI